MSLTSDTMTPADIAAVCGNNNRNNDGMFGNDWAWIVILLLFGWGRNGFGGFGGGQDTSPENVHDFHRQGTRPINQRSRGRNPLAFLRSFIYNFF